MPIQLVILLAVATVCLGQTSLTQYLNLSSSQTTAIGKLTADYQNYASRQNSQQFVFDSQISGLLKAPSPDPAAIGKVVADQEYSRRDTIAKQAELQKSLSAQFNDSQSALVRNLVQAAELLPLAQDARCAYLVAPLTNQRLGALFLEGGFLSYLPIGTLPISIPTAPTATFCNSPIFPISVRDYLSMSDTQIAVIAQASAGYNDFKLRSTNRLADLDAQIQATVAAGNANALALGLLYTEKNRINADLVTRDTALRAYAQAQLTSQQQMKLKTIQDVATLDNAGLISNALNCNFFVLPAGSSAYGTALTGDYTYCSL